MKIDIRETLEFFDGKHSYDAGHASGVVGIIGEDLNSTAFKHFMENKGAKVEILSTPVTTGKVKGKRLDRWIYVKEKNGKEILYQTEIKNWSSWAFNGTPLPIDASDEKVLQVAKHYWDGQKNVNFVKGEHPNNVTKVLVSMTPPREYKSISIKPLLIYWMPISNSYKIDPLFSVETSKVISNMESSFKLLNIFSVSLYLRELLKSGKSQLELELPSVESRMTILKKIVKI